MIRIIDTLFLKKGHRTNDRNVYNVEEEDDDVLDEQMHYKNIYDKTFGITAKDAVFKKQNKHHFIMEQFASVNNRMIEDKKLYVSTKKQNSLNDSK